MAKGHKTLESSRTVRSRAAQTEGDANRQPQPIHRTAEKAAVSRVSTATQGTSNSEFSNIIEACLDHLSPLYPQLSSCSPGAALGVCVRGWGGLRGVLQLVPNSWINSTHVSFLNSPAGNLRLL